MANGFLCRTVVWIERGVRVLVGAGGGRGAAVGFGGLLGFAAKGGSG